MSQGLQSLTAAANSIEGQEKVPTDHAATEVPEEQLDAHLILHFAQEAERVSSTQNRREQSGPSGPQPLPDIRVDSGNESSEGIVKEEKKTKNVQVTRKTKVVQIPEEVKECARNYMDELRTKRRGKQLELVCKICNDGKKFSTAYTLMNHYRSHAGIKRYHCGECDAFFTRHNSLKYHILVHEGKFRYECEHCRRQFRHKGHLQEHRRLHTGETPFQCDECNPPAKWTTRNSYKRHLKTHHGKIWSKTGVTQLSKEEFAKVRTKNAKKLHLQ